MGLGSQPSLQGRQPWRYVGARWPRPRALASSAGPFLTSRLGEHCTRRQPPVYRHLPHRHGAGRAGKLQPWQHLGGHTKESKGRVWGRADWPSASSTQIGVGILSSSCNHFYLILLRVVHGRIYLLSDDALQLWSVYLRRDCILKERITQY